MTETHERTTQAKRVLAAIGVDARVSAAGHEKEIAALRADVGALGAIAAQAPALRALGFRYVAIEIGSAQREAASG